MQSVPYHKIMLIYMEYPPLLSSPLLSGLCSPLAALSSPPEIKQYQKPSK